MGNQSRIRSKDPGLTKTIKEFFAYAKKRESIRLSHQPKEENLDFHDAILHKYRFCNVFREDDKTTIWFRKKVRSKIKDLNHLILATIVFRWFNRIETGERILDVLLTDGWNAGKIRRRLAGVSPLVTGAYMIKTPAGLNKLEGIIWCMKGLTKRKMSEMPRDTLENAHAWMMQFPYLGSFMAYEIITDLRHTKVLNKATGIMTWANPGPGCARGIECVYGEKLGRDAMVAVMRSLLWYSTYSTLWPVDWPKWEMRDVEHTLCEFSKYKQAQAGKRLKRKYNANT